MASESSSKKIGSISLDNIWSAIQNGVTGLNNLASNLTVFSSTAPST